MTPEEHEAQRRMVWIEAMKARVMSPNDRCDGPITTANRALAAFDARFPAPAKSENEG